MPYRFLDFELDPQRFRLTRDGAAVHTPRQIFDLILFLVRHRDRPVAKEEILDAIWRGRSVTNASLTHAIAEARKLLGDTQAAQSTIKTIHGRGYWWVAETVETGGPLGLGTTPHSLPFVGRAAELGVLSAGLTDASRGKGRLVLISGEAGVGKSRLTDEFATQASREGSVIVRACAEDLSPTPPFYLWRQLLKQLIEHGVRIPKTLAAWVDSGAYWGRDLAGTTRWDIEAHRESAAARTLLYESLELALREASDIAPMVVVLEDVHQADPSSMQTVDHIATVLERLRVLVLATLRPSQDATSSASLANLARQRFATSIVLQGLSRSEVETLLRELSDPRLPIGASEIVFDASAGNPFLLTQIVTIARSRSAVKERSDLSNLPTAVRAAISAQARDLPENCVHTLRVASILGRAFDMRVLAEVMRLEILDVSRYLAPGIQASLIRPSKTPGVLEFSHALLREALYEENDPHSRAQLHLSAGVAMLRILGKECDDQLPSVALHFREAALVGGRDQAISLLERCGDLAHRNLAFADAANFLSDALELRKGQAQRDLPSEVNVLLSLGSARLCSGDRGGARQALITAAEVAAGFGGLAQVSEAAFRLSPGVLSLEVGVVDRALIALIERALSAVGHDHESMRLALMGRLALALYWSDDDARRGELVRALRDETISDPVDRLSSILFAIGADWGPDTLSDRRALLDEVHSRRHMLNSQLGVVTRVFRVATFLESGCLDLMDREVESLETELARAGMPYGAWYPLMFRTTQALIRGEYDRATRCAGEYLRTGSRFEDANVLHSFGAQIAEIEWLRGRAGVALESGRQFAERFASMAEWRCILPFFLSIEGRRAEAEESLRRLAAREFEAVRRSSGWTLAMCALAEACSRLRLSEWAPVLYEQLLPFRGQNAVVGLGVVSWGSVSRFLGLLAHLSGLPRDSEDLLEEAIQADSTAGAPSWIARSELAMAIVLSRQGTRGKSERAKSLARRACERARAIGAIQIEKDAREAGLISRRS